MPEGRAEQGIDKESSAHNVGDIVNDVVHLYEPLVGGSGRTFAGVMLKLLGEDGLRQFVTEQAVFTPKMMDLVERMARGEAVFQGIESLTVAIDPLNEPMADSSSLAWADCANPLTRPNAPAMSSHLQCMGTTIRQCRQRQVYRQALPIFARYQQGRCRRYLALSPRY